MHFRVMIRTEISLVNDAYLGYIPIISFLNTHSLDSSTYELTAAVQEPTFASAVGKCLKELTFIVDKTLFGAGLSLVSIAT